jgi:F-type H+-transporting ATP synthase subunit e
MKPGFLHQCETDSLQVLRYSALLFGVFYGFTHQRALNSDAKAFHAKQEWSHKEDVIKQAKKAWAEKQLTPEQRAKGDGGMSETRIPLCSY